ncbi:radical SAM protein [uncultured Phascolarctobacterium sp.]|uniref:radical SAM protein n=1 Tax=uncultured Phascolarctobacterium sp. TaxID=512296 RepID=UPI00260B6308|nr:radical SAM protein [uncultured Phascolarctobacterium sp.]
MILKWLNIYLGGACNGSCKYCFRNFDKKPNVPNIATDEFKEYLKEYSFFYKRVVFIGGEPLLYFKTIKDCCTVIPKFVPKRIMTNGILLTKEVVEYCNENNIEIALSYDGKSTKKNRGCDILDKKRDVIPLISKLYISSVISGENIDMIEVYNDIQEKLNNKPFNHIVNVYLNKNDDDRFLDKFDYKVFRKNLVEYQTVYKSKNVSVKQYKDCDDVLGTMVLLNGDIVCLTTFKKYGTVFDDEDIVHKKIRDDFKKCSGCKYTSVCFGKRQLSNKHFCNAEFAIIEASNYLENEKRYENLYRNGY